ncbi:MAG: ATP-binding protein [Rickettsiales bacterium]|nr:ATP-binding protein [Rickettsiales bacterium]
MTFYNGLLNTIFPALLKPMTDVHNARIRVPYFFNLNKQHSFENIINKPNRFFIEHSLYNNHLFPLESIIRSNPDFSLSLTTRSCYNHKIAPIITKTVCSHFNIPQQYTIPITTCMHEALINSVVHGNLKIGGHFKNQKNFESYYQEVQDKLADPQLAAKYVNILLWYKSHRLILSISDEGQGSPLLNYTPDFLPYGRGLILIQSLANKVWVGEDNHTLFMAFEW